MIDEHWMELFERLERVEQKVVELRSLVLVSAGSLMMYEKNEDSWGREDIHQEAKWLAWIAEDFKE